MDGDVGHSYLRISLMMWSGIWVFFMIERIMKVINDERAVSSIVLYHVIFIMDKM